MKLSRFFSLSLLVVFLLSVLALPVLAAETYSFSLSLTEDFGLFCDVSSVPSVGNYYVVCTLISNSGEEFSFSEVSSLVFIEEDDVSFYYLPCFFRFEGGSLPLDFVFYDEESDGSYVLCLDLSGVSSCYLELEKITSPAFEESTAIGLETVLSWVGSVINSLVSGPLAPLLGVMAIAITITVVLVAVKIIRSFSWGL